MRYGACPNWHEATMSETKELETVIVARSDGADTGPGYWPITATPAVKKPTTPKEVPEKTPRAKPQMIRLNDDDPRFIEWKVKLGMLLKQELAPDPDGMPHPQPQTQT